VTASQGTIPHATRSLFSTPFTVASQRTRGRLVMYVCMYMYVKIQRHQHTRVRTRTQRLAIFTPQLKYVHNILPELWICTYVCMHVCKDSAAPAHERTRAHRPAAPRQSSGVSQTPPSHRGRHVYGSRHASNIFGSTNWLLVNRIDTYYYLSYGYGCMHMHFKYSAGPRVNPRFEFGSCQPCSVSPLEG